jgi:hypothetical protein
MKTSQRVIALTELFLVFPASLFMTALFVRDLQPSQFEPARTAGRVVDWFSARPFLGLDIFLVTLPFVGLLLGCVTVLRSWRLDESLRKATLQMFAVVRAHFATLLIAGTSLVAAGILFIVGLHVITD